jgi:hypothetical protein
MGRSTEQELTHELKLPTPRSGGKGVASPGDDLSRNDEDVVCKNHPTSSVNFRS